ncbi:MAG: putative DNA-binding domain-containing protein [Myxococcales bacterium]|nr:putative DNA-binding domain-containing protein [Myxococcales bacterium]
MSDADTETLRARALENAMARLALGPEVADDPESISCWLANAGVHPEDRAALVETGLGRLSVYRRLVRGNVQGAIELAIPRSIYRMGTECFERYLARWLAEEGPKTHYLRDVTREFLDYCELPWQSDAEVPGYLMNLARHEALRIEVASETARPADAEPGELELDRPARFIEAVRLVRYEYAVHQLSEDETDETLPERRATRLLVYRSPTHEVRYLELTPLAATILERLIAGDPLQQALLQSCSALGVSLTQDVLDGTARVLADLAERGALLGSD